MGLHLAEYYQKEIEVFYEQNKVQMDSMRKELTKRFPSPTGKFTELRYDL